MGKEAIARNPFDEGEYSDITEVGQMSAMVDICQSAMEERLNKVNRRVGPRKYGPKYGLEKIKCGTYIESDLYHAAKMLAANEEVPLRDILEEGLRLVFKKYKVKE